MNTSTVGKVIGSVYNWATTPSHLNFQRHPELKQLHDAGAKEEHLKTALELKKESTKYGVYDFQLESIFKGMVKILTQGNNVTPQHLRTYAETFFLDIRSGRLLDRDWYGEVATIAIQQINSGEEFKLPSIGKQTWTFKSDSLTGLIEI